MTATRVIVVEDERIVALHLKQQLVKLGYEVVGVAASGEQALRLVNDLRPDVVLMDIHIEGAIDGIETTERIPAELMVPLPTPPAAVDSTQTPPASVMLP